MDIDPLQHLSPGQCCAFLTKLHCDSMSMDATVLLEQRKHQNNDLNGTINYVPCLQDIIFDHTLRAQISLTFLLHFFFKFIKPLLHLRLHFKDMIRSTISNWFSLILGQGFVDYHKHGFYGNITNLFN